MGHRCCSSWLQTQRWPIVAAALPAGAASVGHRCACARHYGVFVRMASTSGGAGAAAFFLAVLQPVPNLICGLPVRIPSVRCVRSSYWGHADTSDFSAAHGRLHRSGADRHGTSCPRPRPAPPPTVTPHGSNGIEHVVVLMMENRSFDHFLSWLPGADGRHDLIYLSTDGNFYPNYPLAPDFQGCGYSDPDHSWEGFLVQHNFGKMDGFLQRPTAPAGNPGVTLATANTFPIGYYTNRNPDGTPQGRARPAGHRRAGRALHGPGPLLLLVRRRDLPEPLLPARGPDRPGPQQRRRSPRCRPSGTSCRRSPTTRASRPAGTSSVTCRSWRCGARSTSRSGTRSPPATPTRSGIPVTTPSFIDTVAAGNSAQRQLRRPGLRHRGQRHLGRRPPAGRHPARRAVHRRRLPRPGQRRLPGQHGVHRHLRRVGRLLRPRAAAAGHRRHQPGQRRPHRRRHDADRRPADPRLPPARLPGAGHRGLQPGAGRRSSTTARSSTPRR